MNQIDDFDDPRAGRLASLLAPLKGRGPVIAGGAAAVLLLVLGTVIWASYPRHPQDPAAVPTVHADAGPYREAPQDPGGMEIPYKDSTVFNALHPAAGPPATAAPEGEKVENLMNPPPEAPIAKEKMFAGVGSDPTAAAPAQTPASTPEAVTAPEVQGAEAQMPPMPAVKPEEKKPETAEEKKPEEKKAESKPESKPAASGGYFVQLGSVHSEKDAGTHWKKLQSTYPQLAALSLHVEEADLAKGKYYRVQGGPVDQQKAKDICQAVTAQKPGGCLVVKR